MKIVWNKVTWYSNFLSAVLFIALPFVGFYLGIIYEKIVNQPTPVPVVKTVYSQYTITALDNGNIFIYEPTSRLSVILDSRSYPKANLACQPAGILGTISNIPPVNPPFYAARFETLKKGNCLLKDGDFEVTIVVR
ncbi:MAG TPA: hypothetical protein VMU70_01970 [Candidatus Tyrphobacter sp.]|nr:hypothetical protein [Candidatus Tyrphobacter sp.]